MKRQDGQDEKAGIKAGRCWGLCLNFKFEILNLKSETVLLSSSVLYPVYPASYPVYPVNCF